MYRESLLSNIRVVEVGEGLVGPWAGLLLADLGAEVIKVESITRTDLTRGPVSGFLKNGPLSFYVDYPDGNPGERPWNRHSHFNAYNFGKYDITLDLTKPRGLQVFLKIVRVSDVFLSNMAAGVAEKLAIAYEDIVKVNPRIVYLSATGFGRNGPYATRVAMGNTIDAAAGLFCLRDYGDGDSSSVSADVHCDVIGASTNAFAILTGLYRRQKTGKGVFIDISMVEPSMAHIGEAIMEYTMNGRVQRCLGNRDASMVQGCYRCQGQDEWVTLSIASDEEWRRFTAIMGSPQLVDDERFANILSRLKNQDELDNLIGAWTSSRTKFEVMDMLEGAGIAAGAVLNNEDVYRDPRVKERGFLDTVEDPDAGVHTYAGRLWKLQETELPKRRPAPLLGEHNEHVFKNIIGMTPDEIAELEREGITGTMPTGEVP